MLGFIIGTICLVALIRVARRGRGGGCGRGRRWGRHGGGGWGGGGGFRHGWLRWMYEALDTSPGQEQVLRGAIDDLRAAAQGAREEGQRARMALAESLRADSFDEAEVQKAYARLEVEAQQVRDRFIDNLRRVHETLTPEQRKRLSAMVSRGGSWNYGA